MADVDIAVPAGAAAHHFVLLATKLSVTPTPPAAPVTIAGERRTMRIVAGYAASRSTTSARSVAPSGGAAHAWAPVAERSPRGHSFFFCRDFDGNLIELMDLGYMYHVLGWLGPLGGWIFRRGMYKGYYR